MIWIEFHLVTGGVEVNNLKAIFGSTNQTSQGWFHRLEVLVGVWGLGFLAGVVRDSSLYIGQNNWCLWV